MAAQLTATNGPLAPGAHVVQRLREHFLAGARLAGEQHARPRARHALKHVPRGHEAGGYADERFLPGLGLLAGHNANARLVPRAAGAVATSLQRLHAKRLHLLGNVAPDGGGLAHQPAVRRPHPPALQLAEQDELAEKLARVAGSVGGLHPAHRIGGEAERPRCARRPRWSRARGTLRNSGRAPGRIRSAWS